MDDSTAPSYEDTSDDLDPDTFGTQTVWEEGPKE